MEPNSNKKLPYKCHYKSTLIDKVSWSASPEKEQTVEEEENLKSIN